MRPTSVNTLKVNKDYLHIKHECAPVTRRSELRVVTKTGDPFDHAGADLAVWEGSSSVWAMRWSDTTELHDCPDPTGSGHRSSTPVSALYVSRRQPRWHRADPSKGGTDVEETSPPPVAPCGGGGGDGGEDQVRQEPAAEPDPPQPEPATEPAPSVGHWLANHMFPDVGRLPRRQRILAASAVLAIGAMVAVLAVPWGLVTDALTAETRVQIEEDAADRFDQQQAPFVAVADYGVEAPPFGQILMDRALTAEEEAFLGRLLAEEDPFVSAWNFFRPRGGRMLRTPTGELDAGGPTEDPDEVTDGSGNYSWFTATAFKLDIFSSRSSALSITDMGAVDVSCHQPTARTVVQLVPEGGGPRPGVMFDLSRPGAGPTITDEDDFGEPYFDHHKIDLGKGLSPGGLLVEAVVNAETCSWRIEARYRDANDSNSRQLIDDNGKPFVAEGTPQKVEQYWTNTWTEGQGPTMIACHKHPTDNACSPRFAAVR
ncbi:hypothetical protein [Virgisporangium aurantiacum]|uniref:Uncharacterized protein n=1 Tax=Virgisporangium aurantiacum TaxID=175570 RepID=A0A8J3ZFJ9_9ACTN|nr:hypothetical protein [Virgisporangium aurantiacum]GIJ61878.1 hypothetical protein Vau01_093940 [Virgisporangium aurantiacum]